MAERTNGIVLQPGDQALTDFNGPGSRTKVRIIERDDRRRHGHSQTGVMFRVVPILRHGTNQTWYCADWFEPLPNKGAPSKIEIANG